MLWISTQYSFIFTPFLYFYSKYISSRSSIGWAELWRCLGCKFESYLEQLKGSDGIGRHE